MEFYEITIRPDSGFGTSVKGDTLFGHFCWQAAHDPDLLKTSLDTAIEQYARKPFAVFSSAVPTNAVQGAPHCFKRPDIPLEWFLSSEHLSKKEKILAAKALKGKKWLKGNADLILDATRRNLAADTDFKDNGLAETGTCAHNTINRMTGTTGKGRFAPFETSVFRFYPGVLLSLFVLIDPKFLDKDHLVKGMSRIGKFGFGRDASTGMGRFTIIDTCPLPLPDLSAGDGLYTLAPCLPEKGRFNQTWFSPFVRFGKHGDLLAGVRQPFKNPVIMADEGAVCVPAETIDTPYIGCAVTNVSKAMPETVVQAYAPVLPIRIGGFHENNL
ncbi:hypothetical protein [Desulfobacter postgatei]|uniref:type III-A CRISPR-associated RAMP protein Csm4 n=1 Tax=Desulfobacter postgatei TaxID=2293 RepID=UPI00259B5AC3|nr:hypothetical protein [uncultured Desulfobacter sp.]